MKYYDDDGITIYCGDSMEIVPQFNFTVDMINTDPPYNVGKYYGDNFDDNRPEKEYFTWYEEIFRRLFTCIVERGLLYVSSTTAQICEITSIMKRIGWNWVQMLVWNRPNMINSRKMFGSLWSQTYEPINLFCKGKRPRMHSTHESMSVQTADVFRIASPQRNTRESLPHPTQKPLRLYTSILSRSPGELILDPFMGSGTTLAAAKMIGRRAIGIDREERYCEIAAKRVEQQELWRFSKPQQRILKGII